MLRMLVVPPSGFIRLKSTVSSLPFELHSALFCRLHPCELRRRHAPSAMVSIRACRPAHCGRWARRAARSIRCAAPCRPWATSCANRRRRRRSRTPWFAWPRRSCADHAQADIALGPGPFWSRSIGDVYAHWASCPARRALALGMPNRSDRRRFRTISHVFKSRHGVPLGAWGCAVAEEVGGVLLTAILRQMFHIGASG
jgi:hypothetical protein